MEIAKGLGSDSHIYCFEPCQQTFEHLCERVSKHPTGVDITPINAAMADCDGTKILHVHGELAGSNSLFDREILAADSCSVEQIHVVRGTTFCREQNIDEISFLKIDVEGAEMDVLKGCEELLDAQKIGCIQFEYGGTWIDARTFLLDAFVLLQSKGYSVGKIFPDGVKFYKNYTPQHETFQYANWLAVREDWTGSFKQVA
jgi:FkbM family methyltransferase